MRGCVLEPLVRRQVLHTRTVSVDFLTARDDMKSAECPVEGQRWIAHHLLHGCERFRWLGLHLLPSHSVEVRHLRMCSPVATG